MKLKKAGIKFLSVLLVMLSLFSYVAVGAYCADSNDNTEGAESETIAHALVIKSESLSVQVRKTTQLTASVTNTDEQVKITWKSLNPEFATVDEDGVVKGVAVGKAVIIATATVDGETINGEFAINVVKNGNFIQDFLTKRQVLSYQYSYVDDYYYTNDKEAWQYNFGFGKIYDFVSPYILLEYDYIRIFFTYDDKDWMLQMWKGQYGMIFYGGEIGIYNRTHSEEGLGEWAMYNCAPEEDWLPMEMTLYHQDINGNYVREFTREYDKYWWCTGFKNGHLRQEEPADELRLEARITFKDETMRDLIAAGLADCGFGEVEDKASVGLDQFCKDGNDIYFIWQNISEAESTMAIKVVGGLLASLAALPAMPLILPYAGFFIFLVFIASSIV